MFTLNSYMRNPKKNNELLNLFTDLFNSNKDYPLIEDKFYASIKKNKKFQYFLYDIQSDNILIYHFKIPSDSKEHTFYDVFLEFIYDKQIPSDITDCHIRFYSNAPSFLYKFAYVFNQQGHLSEMVKPFINKIYLTTSPVKTNPLLKTDYEKTITYALLYLMYNRLYLKVTFNSIIHKISKIGFLDILKTKIYQETKKNTIKAK